MSTPTTTREAIDWTKPVETVHTKRAVKVTPLLVVGTIQYVIEPLERSWYWLAHANGDVWMFCGDEQDDDSEPVRNVVPAPAAMATIDPHRPVEGVTLWNSTDEHSRIGSTGAIVSVDHLPSGYIDRFGEIIDWKYAGDTLFSRGIYNPAHTVEILTAFRDKIRAERAAKVEKVDWHNVKLPSGRVVKAWARHDALFKWWIEYGSHRFYVGDSHVERCRWHGNGGNGILLKNDQPISDARLAELDAFIDHDDADVESAKPKALTAGELVPWIGRVLIRRAGDPHSVHLLWKSWDVPHDARFAPLGTRADDDSAWKDRPEEINTKAGE